MAQWMNATNFRVTVEGFDEDTSFVSVSPVSTHVEQIAYKHGMDRTVRMAPGRVTFGNVTLQRSYQADLQRQLSGQGFRVRVSEVMRAAGQDAPRVEVGRPAAHGAESDWLVAIVRGERSLWTIQSPTRGLSYTKLKRLYDLALGKARLNDD